MSMTPEPLHATATWTDDPATEVPNGTTLYFARIAFDVPFIEAYGAIGPEWAIFQGALLTVTVRTSGVIQCQGTAVMVAPGVALCAKHVLEPLMSEIMSGSISVLCAGIRTDGLQLWRVKHVTLINDNDVAILGLVSASQIPQNHTYYHAVVDAQLPQVGENVRMFGFVHTAVPEASVITGSLMASQGDVLDRHDDRRDSVFIRWPSFAVDCHAVGGMSGGPVFNENGHLVGLLCTSFSAGDESGPAYVSALWPALTQVYLGGWPEPMFGGFHDLLSLSTEASIPQFEIVNSHLIEVFERDGERVTRYHVRT